MITARLNLTPLAEKDAVFIQELLNTEGWIRYIGNRNIGNEEDAKAYIKRISDNPATNYWVANLQESGVSVGLVTLIQRDYLENPDIGFAFLPQYGGKGYAYEAAKGLVDFLVEDQKVTYILASIVPGNIRSIRLIEKLGLVFDRKIFFENEPLLIFKGLFLPKS